MSGRQGPILLAEGTGTLACWGGGAVGTHAGNILRPVDPPGARPRDGRGFAWTQLTSLAPEPWGRPVRSHT